MSNFNNLLGENDTEVPVLKEISIANKSVMTESFHKGTKGNSRETKKTIKSKADKKVDTNSVLESLMRKKETSRLGLTIDKEIYDKLKTISMSNYNETGTKKSVTKVVSQLLEEALKNVEIDYKLVEAFDENFKEKRKK